MPNQLRFMPAALLTTHIMIEDETVPVRIRHNPRARRFILRLDHKTGDVVVTSPTKKGMKEALSFAERERAWIADKRRALPKPVLFEPGAEFPFRGHQTTLRHDAEKRRTARHLPEDGTLWIGGDPAFFARRTQDFLKKEARTDLISAVSDFTRRMERPLPKVTVRDTSSRWGSCSTSGALSFSWRLVLAPAEILTYVAAHECAHLEHHNHSEAFWRQVADLDPNYKRAEAWLAREGSDLFRYGGKAPPTEAPTL